MGIIKALGFYKGFLCYFCSCKSIFLTPTTEKKVQNGVTTIAIVECKGGISPLSCRGGNQQGTKEYMKSIIDNMIGKSNDLNIPTSQEFKDTSLTLKNAYDDENIKYYLVRQPFNDNDLKNTEIKQFKITW